eukprot:gnl/MRDRNA2_/MRDRNA2_36057_c0_seq1.p1 gnl/MRDRNA2_/MRDRNA2_36057_c0~~gnl/MRDRNA2_/MRDRNA2_36057_c0_seq1.p1  ORF type:complete len:388 (+),score=47.10 gnl/MRDRNA2_/MRDRNA2_36057_c0_seq1:71-1234(+)
MRFSSVGHGDLVHVSADGLSAHHVSSEDDAMYGVVLSEQPLELITGGYYFELSIDAIQEDTIGGIALGVTTTCPEELTSLVPSSPEAAVEVPFCWCIGFYGTAFSSCHGNFVDVPWDPQQLILGDRVGLHITCSGVMTVIQNGHVVAESPDRVPTDVPLFAVVDLIGTTAGVSIISDDIPITSSTEQDRVGSNQMARPRRNGSSGSRSSIGCMAPGRQRAIGQPARTGHVPSCATVRRSTPVGGFKPERPVPPRPSFRRGSCAVPTSVATPMAASRRSSGYMNVPIPSMRARSSERSLIQLPRPIHSSRLARPVCKSRKCSVDSAVEPQHVEADECSICLELLGDQHTHETSVRCLPCSHRFHTTCIDHWLQQNGTCPMCRSNIPEC